MRSNGAAAAVGSPRAIASAALPFAPPCTYPRALNSPHLVGMRVDATRLSELVSSVWAMRSRSALRCVRNGAAGAQTFDFGRVESELLQNLLVVLADVRRALRR